MSEYLAHQGANVIHRQEWFLHRKEVATPRHLGILQQILIVGLHQTAWRSDELVWGVNGSSGNSNDVAVKGWLTITIS